MLAGRAKGRTHRDVVNLVGVARKCNCNAFALFTSTIKSPLRS